MAEAARWLILVHQLPAHPSALRVRVWRRLQEIGAAVLRNSLYVLPATDEAREDFNWVREEIEAGGGQVSLLEARAIDGYTDQELMQQFREQRTAEYETLATTIRAALNRRGRAGHRELLMRGWREQLAAIRGLDHFNAAVRALVEQVLHEFEAAVVPPAAASTAPPLAAAGFRHVTWLTRPRPGIDRMASAWLIRRFISPKATFAFADGAGAPRRGHVPFDLPDVEFGHHGAHCTFETLMHRFAISDPALVPLSRIVHDLDLKESRYAMPEAPALARIVDGLRAAHRDDAVLLEHGMAVFEALYRSFQADGLKGRSRARR
jgi:hypothetical protein